MRRLVFPYFASFILAVILLACQSKSEPVSASPRYPDEPVKTPVALNYHDTTKPEYKALIHELDSFYERQVRAGFNGSVLVGYKGKVLYERYFGYAEREEKRRLNPNTAVQLASISKTFTAAAILYLDEHNYLDINHPVKTYIKDFPYPDVTVKTLLNHRSGIPDYLKWVPQYRKNTSRQISNETLLVMFSAHKPRLEFKPNTRFKYSNSNYAILASIIERVTEMKYHDFMKQYIFEPLGMMNTFVYDLSKGLPESASISYKSTWVREPYMFADGVVGDKNIYSTPRDMYIWDQSFYKQKLLSINMVELAYTPCSFERPGVRNYGLGWRMFCYPDGNKIVYHNGWWHGNNTVFYRYIQDNYTVVVLGNKYNRGIYRQEKGLTAITGLANSVGEDQDGAD